MKILVIEDDPTHQEAAKAQLKDHDVTVVGSYDEGQALLGAEDPYGCKMSGKHNFDAVLVDLIMPSSTQMLGRGASSSLMPVGIFLALLAARNGAKYVAVFTDSNHHDNAASACFDAFHARGAHQPKLLQVEGAKVLFCNSPNAINSFSRDDLSKKLTWSEAQKQPSVLAKNWLVVLDFLLGKVHGFSCDL